MSNLSFRQRLGLFAARMAVKISGIQPRDPAVTYFFNGGSVSASGVDVTENTALNVSTIWAAVNLLSSSIACMPVCFYRRKAGRAKEAVEDGREAMLLRNPPNPEMTQVVFRECLQAHILLWGNAYAEIERDKGARPIALWPLTPNRVRPARGPDGRLCYLVKVPDDSREVPLDAANVLHVPGLGFDGLCGYSVVQMARESFGLAIATERHGAALFGNGARPGGVLTSEQRLQPDAVQNLRQSWNEQHQGLSNSQRIAILHSGLAWQQTTMTSEDAQYLETRKFQVEEVARWFSVPPHLLRHLDRATYSNIEHQGSEFVKYSLGPWMTKWEQELNRKLLGPDGPYFYEFYPDALQRADMKTRYESYKVARDSGWMSANDIRAREGDNSLEGTLGDHYLVPQNYRSVEQLEMEIANGDTGAANGGGGTEPAGGGG